VAKHEKSNAFMGKPQRQTKQRKHAKEESKVLSVINPSIPHLKLLFPV
jgi:hypothetical protein